MTGEGILLETLTERGEAAKPRPQDPPSQRKMGLQRQPEGQGTELCVPQEEVPLTSPAWLSLLNYPLHLAKGLSAAGILKCLLS